MLTCRVTLFFVVHNMYVQNVNIAVTASARVVATDFGHEIHIPKREIEVHINVCLKTNNSLVIAERIDL